MVRLGNKVFPHYINTVLKNRKFENYESVNSEKKCFFEMCEFFYIFKTENFKIVLASFGKVVIFNLLNSVV